MPFGPNVTHVLTDPYHWVLGDETFDVVISRHTFEHIPFFWLTWKEMVRVLKRSGLIFLIMPSSGVELLNPVDRLLIYRDGFQALGDESIRFQGEPLGVLVPLRSAPPMEPSSSLRDAYQFRVVVPGEHQKARGDSSVRVE